MSGRCDHCGREQDERGKEPQSVYCAPPFKVQRHSYTGAHPAGTQAMTRTPSPTVIEEARKMAADYIATIYGETYRKETLDGTRWLRLSDAFIAAIELGERRAEAAVVGWLRGICHSSASLFARAEQPRPTDGPVETIDGFETGNTVAPNRPTEATGKADAELAGFAPCPTCRQYSHSLRDDLIGEAHLHFEAMTDHRGDGIPTMHLFNAKTRDMAQRVLAALTAGADGAKAAENEPIRVCPRDIK